MKEPSCCQVGNRRLLRTACTGPKFYLVHAGFLEASRRAHFRTAPRGSEVLVRHPERVARG